MCPPGCLTTTGYLSSGISVEGGSPGREGRTKKLTHAIVSVLCLKHLGDYVTLGMGNLVEEESHTFSLISSLVILVLSHVENRILVSVLIMKQQSNYYVEDDSH
jgi:hypothetical protein